MVQNNQEQPPVVDDLSSPTKWGGGDGYWDAAMAKRLRREPSAAKRAIMLAEALEECAATFRQGPFMFPVTVYRADEPKMEAVRRVAQLARTVAGELRALAGDGGDKPPTKDERPDHSEPDLLARAEAAEARLAAALEALEAVKAIDDFMLEIPGMHEGDEVRRALTLVYAVVGEPEPKSTNWNRG